MSNIAIIGAGYVGKAAAEIWKAEGHIITLTTRSKERVLELSPFANRVVIITPGQFEDALQGQDIVLLSVAPDRQDEDEATYLGSAKALLKDLNPKTQQILYTSSTSVYGEHGGALVDETSPCKPQTKREKILFETEQLLLKAPCKVCILRLGEIVGPGRMIVDRLRALRGPLPGTGEAITNISPLEIIVRALSLAVHEQWEGIYNVCNDLHISRRELYDNLCREYGLPTVQWDPTKISLHAGNKKVSNQKYKLKL